jgi:hypothetical protein
MAISESVILRGTQDPGVLEMAAREGQVLLTDNIKDVAALDAIWAAQGRTHAGVLFISSRTYPQNRARIGALVAVLEARQSSPDGPSPGSASSSRPSETGAPRLELTPARTGENHER